MPSATARGTSRPVRGRVPVWPATAVEVVAPDEPLDAAVELELPLEEEPLEEEPLDAVTALDEPGDPDDPELGEPAPEPDGVEPLSGSMYCWSPAEVASAVELSDSASTAPRHTQISR